MDNVVGFWMEYSDSLRLEPVAGFRRIRILSARALLHQLEDCTWTSLRLYTRAPLLRPEGFVFEAIDKVFELRNGTLLFILESGTALSESKFVFLGAEPLQNAKEVFSRH